LEIYLPTKPITKEKVVSSRVILHTRDYSDWALRGLFTLGIAYYYYILLTLNDMNDHWLHPHGKYEKTTRNDLFISTILTVVLSFFIIPFLQYMRYHKLRQHLLNAPPNSVDKLPQKGIVMLILFIFFDLLVLGIITMLFLGLGTIFADLFIINFESTLISTIFFSSAAVIFILVILSAILIYNIEKRWQEAFNFHVIWHLNKAKHKK